MIWFEFKENWNTLYYVGLNLFCGSRDKRKPNFVFIFVPDRRQKEVYIFGVYIPKYMYV